MNTELLQQFETDFDSLLEQKKSALNMPGTRGTVSGALERMEALQEVLTTIGATANEMANQFLQQHPEEDTAELRDEMIKIARPKLQAYVIGAWKNG